MVLFIGVCHYSTIWNWRWLDQWNQAPAAIPTKGYLWNSTRKYLTRVCSDLTYLRGLVANVRENSKKIIEHWRNVLKYELWTLHTNKDKSLIYREFSGRIFLEKSFLYKYVGSKIVKRMMRKKYIKNTRNC